MTTSREWTRRAGVLVLVVAASGFVDACKKKDSKAPPPQLDTAPGGGLPGAVAPSESPAELANQRRIIGHMVEAMPTLNPADITREVLNELSEESLLGATECAKAVGDYTMANPATKAALVSVIRTACAFDCPSDAVFATLGQLSPAAARAAIADDCDLRQADPLAGATIRSAADYVVLRGALVHVLGSLDGDPDPSARELATKLRAAAAAIAEPGA